MRVPGIEADSDRGKRIRTAREAAGFTQKQLAERVDATVRAIQLWEKGEVINRSNVAVLARALGTTPAYILKGEVGRSSGTDVGEVADRVRELEVAITELRRQVQADVGALTAVVERLALAAPLPGEEAGQHSEAVVPRRRDARARDSR